MKTKEEILDKNYQCSTPNRKRLLDVMEEYAQEYYNHNKIELKDSDCTCYGDHHGMATNPECIIHGKNRK